MGQVISVENLSFAYHKRDFVLNHVTFHVDENDFIYIVGPNGGGKTTLLKIILGMVAPNEGSIKILGSAPDKARKLIGYMPQQMQFDFDFPLTVLDCVKLGLIGKKIPRSRERERSLLALDQVGMQDFSSRSFANLSGGQRQRVLIARALASDPQILILDEPTANVDHEVAMKLVSLLKDLNKRMTILMVSHDYRFVSDVAAKVFCVNRSVAVHPTLEISENLIRDVFQQNLKVIQHHVCIEDHDHHAHEQKHKQIKE